MTPSSHRSFTETELVLASHNAGKLREIAALFEGHPFTVTSASRHGVPSRGNRGRFSGNGWLKAHYHGGHRQGGVADDSRAWRAGS